MSKFSNNSDRDSLRRRLPSKRPAGHAANGKGGVLIKLKHRLLCLLTKPLLHGPLNGTVLPAVAVLAEVRVLFAGQHNTRVSAHLVPASQKLELALRRIVYILIRGHGGRIP